MTTTTERDPEHFTATDWPALELIHFCQVYTEAYNAPAHSRQTRSEQHRALADRLGISKAAQDRAARSEHATTEALDYVGETSMPEHRLGACLTAAGAYQLLRAAGATGQYLIETTLAHYHATIDDYDPTAHNHP